MSDNVWSTKASKCLLLLPFTIFLALWTAWLCFLTIENIKGEINSDNAEMIFEQSLHQISSSIHFWVHSSSGTSSLIEAECCLSRFFFFLLLWCWWWGSQIVVITYRKKAGFAMFLEGGSVCRFPTSSTECYSFQQRMLKCPSFQPVSFWLSLLLRNMDCGLVYRLQSDLWWN